LARDGDQLEAHYRHLLDTLGKQGGLLGVVFRRAQNKIQDPAKLRRLIDGQDLGDLVLQHYDQFDPRYKGLIRLKRAYVPVLLEEPGG
jgi:type I restriction enzyme M protein